MPLIELMVAVSMQDTAIYDREIKPEGQVL